MTILPYNIITDPEYPPTYLVSHFDEYTAVPNNYFSLQESICTSRVPCKLCMFNTIICNDIESVHTALPTLFPDLYKQYPELCI